MGSETEITLSIKLLTPINLMALGYCILGVAVNVVSCVFPLWVYEAPLTDHTLEAMSFTSILDDAVVRNDHLGKLLTRFQINVVMMDALNAHIPMMLISSLSFVVGGLSFLIHDPEYRGYVSIGTPIVCVIAALVSVICSVASTAFENNQAGSFITYSVGFYLACASIAMGIFAAIVLRVRMTAESIIDIPNN